MLDDEARDNAGVGLTVVLKRVGKQGGVLELEMPAVERVEANVRTRRPLRALPSRKVVAISNDAPIKRTIFACRIDFSGLDRPRDCEFGSTRHLRVETQRGKEGANRHAVSTATLRALRRKRCAAVRPGCWPDG